MTKTEKTDLTTEKDQQAALKAALEGLGRVQGLTTDDYTRAAVMLVKAMCK